MIALTVAITIALIAVAGWMVAGLMFSRSASFGIATVLAGCALLSAISAIFWIGAVIATFGLLIFLVGLCAGEN